MNIKNNNKGKSLVDLPLRQYKLENLTIEEKVGQMLCFAFHGTEYNEQLEKQIKDLHVGGVIHFARNITSNEQVKKLNSDIQENCKIPLFIGVDQEGGMVLRVTEGITPFPGAMSFAASRRSNYNVCKYVGNDLKHLGFNMVFAPCADVNNNPYNPVINSRSYSDDPKIVSEYVISSFKGFQDSLIIPTAKHFPGHGDTSVDSHLSLPTVGKDLNELENLEFVPFKDAVDNGIDGIMASHVLYPAVDDIYPASLSKKIITGILKEKMGFKGLIVTDSLTMGAINNNYSKREIVELAANAGIDLLIFCGKADINDQREIFNEFVSLVKDGKISIDRVNESVKKILEYKEKYQITNLPINLTSKENMKEAIEISFESITLDFDKYGLLDNENLKNNLILFPEIKLSSLVDNDSNGYQTLGKFVNKDNYHEIVFNENLENLQEIIEKSSQYDKIIMCTYNVKENDYYTKLFSYLPKEKVIVVSMRSPYDCMYLDGLSAYICIYEATNLSLNSLSRRLQDGFKNKSGKLPVKLGKTK